MRSKLVREAPPGVLWFAAGAVFCVLGALLADGPTAQEVAWYGWAGAVGFVLLIVAFSDSRGPDRG